MLLRHLESLTSCTVLVHFVTPNDNDDGVLLILGMDYYMWNEGIVDEPIAGFRKSLKVEDLHDFTHTMRTVIFDEITKVKKGSLVP